MARIVYAASGDGYGHAVRAHSVGEGLIARGHDVRFLTSHKGEAYLRNVFPGLVHSVFGLMTIYNEGRAEPAGTLVHNLRRAQRELGPSNRNVRELLRDHRPDLVITDFEPFAARWAKFCGIPFVSLDNQHLLTHCRLDRICRRFRDLATAYLTIRLYFAGARRYLITAFADVPIRWQPATLVDPVLRPKLYTMQPRDGDFLLAYKGAGGENERLRRELEKFDRVPIRAYGFGGQSGASGHITYKPIDPDQFLDDLAGCAGVIASAGHSLVCECLHFRKPMLLVPVQRQYEQIMNAAMVERIGAGQAVAKLSASAIDQFVARLHSFTAAMADRKPARIEPVLDAIEREIR